MFSFSFFAKLFPVISILSRCSAVSSVKKLFHRVICFWYGRILSICYIKTRTSRTSRTGRSDGTSGVMNSSSEQLEVLRSSVIQLLGSIVFIQNRDIKKSGDNSYSSQASQLVSFLFSHFGSVTFGETKRVILFFSSSCVNCRRTG